jgi:hypothetical protein|tara:strand:+ start:17911 stop:18435 length:525 start_codon:yes stop_codon:yes gene_type:complete
MTGFRSPAQQGCLDAHDRALIAKKETTMASEKRNNFTIHARAILAVRHGRELSEQVSAMRDAPTGDLPRTSLTATLKRLAIGEITDGRDLTVLETLRANLIERMSLEVIGSKVEPRLIGYDDDGEVWAWKEVPAYSDRGQEAQSAYERLERFLKLRQQLIDHTNAERLARQLLR